MFRIGFGLIRAAVVVGALACTFMLSGATARPALDVTPWGVALAADGLANIEVGRRPGRTVSFRFRALQSGRIANVRVYLVHREGGYMGGTGGQVRVSLFPDNGAGLPAKRSLASALIPEPTTVDFPLVEFAKAPSVRAGKRYHLVFTNPDPDPVANFVSVNTLYVDSPSVQPVPLVDPQESAVLLKPSAKRAWTFHERRVPIFEVTYTNGRRQGQRYIDARSSSSAVTIGGGTQACQLFMSGRDRVVTSINLRARNAGSSTPLRLELRDDTGTLASASIEPSRLRGTYTWASAPLDFLIHAGVAYRIVLTSDSGPYTVFPYQKGIRYGFGNPFPGGRVVEDSTLDYPVYFASRLVPLSNDVTRDAGSSAGSTTTSLAEAADAGC
jgi:hypothetical protein